MIIKKHVNRGRLVLAMCDKEILGKKFIEGEAILDLTSEFYKGEKTEEKHTEELMKKAYMINAVGEKSVSLLKKKKFVSDGEIKKIDSIPYTNVLFA